MSESDIDTSDTTMDSVMEEYKDLFFMEVREHLQKINDCLIEYEKHDEQTGILDEVFRSAHTIKGSAAMMGFEDISSLTHAMEDAFDHLRKGMEMPEGLMDLFFMSLDMIEGRIKQLEKGEEVELDIDKIVQDIRSSFSDKPVQQEKPVIKKQDDTEFKLESINSIRVQTSELDRLMNLIGELVINKGQLNRIASELQLPEIKHNLENIDRLSVELQDIVTHIRMVPVGQVFNRFPRLVRDLSHQRGKQVNLELEGKDIELDRKVLEEIGEPLIHLIRNSVDHGIESPTQRELNGKPRQGKIKLVAERNQDNILITVMDDGAGIDPERIKKKAIKEGLMSESEVNALTESQLLNLIMLNGFSTATDITEVSGRGVGMNVVKTKITALGGTVLVSSEKGEGTRISLKLPLTISILKAMIVEAGDSTYAIPIKYVKENVSVNASQLHNLGNVLAIPIRDKILKVVHLGKLLNIPYSDKAHKQVLVIQDDERVFGLEVDAITGMREIMIKNMKETLQGLIGVSGVTILGDGSVILVIDPLDLLSN